MGIRTPVTRMKTWCPRPLDDGDAVSKGTVIEYRFKNFQEIFQEKTILFHFFKALIFSPSIFLKDSSMSGLISSKVTLPASSSFSLKTLP